MLDANISLLLRIAVLSTTLGEALATKMTGLSFTLCMAPYDTSLHSLPAYGVGDMKAQA